MTLVYQSYRQHGMPDWIARCLQSVRDWAAAAGFDYCFHGDEIFERVPEWYLAKCRDYPQIATDLGRLILAREHLAAGAEWVIWLDADVLVFDREAMAVDFSAGYVFGRERWVEADGKGGWRVRRNVHNAICAFVADNPMLDFYIHAATNIMRRVEGGVAPQIVGTKFLTAQHNMVGLPLTDAVAMASPPLVADLAAGGGPALRALRAELPAASGAVNLCHSLAQPSTHLTRAMDALEAQPDLLAPA